MNTVESKSAVKNSVLRVMIAAVLIIIQVFLIVKLAIYLSKYYAAFDIIMSLIAFLCVLRIYGRPDNSAFKLSWIVLIRIRTIQDNLKVILDCPDSYLSGLWFSYLSYVW